MREILHADLLINEPLAPAGLGPTAPAGRSLAEARGLAQIEHEVATRERAPFSLLRIGIDGLEILAPAQDRRDALVRAVFGKLRPLVKRGDLCAWREGDQVVACLSGTGVAEAEVIAKQLVEGGRAIALPGAKAPVRASLSIGVAGAQSEATYWFETLLMVAQDGLEVAGAAGSECAVHTELYGMRQKKLERENPGRPPAAKLAPGEAGSRTGTLTAAAWVAAPPAPGSAGTDALSPSAMPAALPHSGPGADSKSGPGPGPRSGPGPGSSSGPSPGLSFDERVRSAFAREGGAGPSTADFEERVLALAHEWAREALQSSLAERDRDHRGDLERLERRLAKLAHALDETESELDRVRAQKSADPGLASAYRGVQGLARETRLYDRKIELLAKLVEANLDLRARFGATG